jgi:hypothetical protein
MILSDVELMTAGEIRLGNNVEIGSGFTGIRMAFPPMDEYPASVSGWHFVGINNDQMMVGISADDGKFYAAGGSMIVDQNAISMSGLSYALQHVATNGSNVRYMRYGMTLPNGSSVPNGEIAFSGPSSASILVNGDFQTNSFTGWTKTTETSGAWTIYTTAGLDRNALWTPTSTTSTGVLTSDRMTSSIAGNSFQLTGTYYNWQYSDFSHFSNDPYATSKMEVKWYDNTVGGSLLRTDTIVFSTNNSGTQTITSSIMQAPSSALSAALVITLINPNAVATGGATAYNGIYFDDLTFAQVAVSAGIRFTPNVTVYGSPLQIAEQATPIVDSGYGAFLVDTAHNPRYIPGNVAQNNLLLHGDVQIAFSTAINTTPATLITKTVTANQLGTKGYIHTHVDILVFNNSGAGRTYTLTYDFGAYTNTVAASTSQGASATNYSVFEFDVYTFNDQAQNAQLHKYSYRRKTNNNAGSASAWTDDFQMWDSSAISTNADVTVDVKISSSNITATQTAKGIGRIIGPFNG